MIITNFTDIHPNAVDMEGAKDVSMRVLLSQAGGAPNFIMRLFEVAPGGHSPFHSHNYEHEVYILGGKGAVRSAQGKTELRVGDALLILPNEKHQFINSGDMPFSFLCMIPIVNVK